jgi:predicted HicB family RNase H-like nuclease
MPRKREGKTETLNLRVSPDFKKRLAEEAAKERRSVTNYLEVTLLDLWEQANRAPGKKRGH